jgi:hypothetical protein
VNGATLKPALARRLVIGLLAFGALGVSGAQLASHAGPMPTRNGHAVAMPECRYHWSPMCGHR